VIKISHKVIEIDSLDELFLFSFLISKFCEKEVGNFSKSGCMTKLFPSFINDNWLNLKHFSKPCFDGMVYAVQKLSKRK
jgi:hypothetical protein